MAKLQDRGKKNTGQDAEIQDNPAKSGDVGKSAVPSWLETEGQLLQLFCSKRSTVTLTIYSIPHA